MISSFKSEWWRLYIFLWGSSVMGIYGKCRKKLERSLWYYCSLGGMMITGAVVSWQCTSVCQGCCQLSCWPQNCEEGVGIDLMSLMEMALLLQHQWSIIVVHMVELLACSSSCCCMQCRGIWLTRWCLLNQMQIMWYHPPLVLAEFTLMWRWQGTLENKIVEFWTLEKVSDYAVLIRYLRYCWQVGLGTKFSTTAENGR